MGKEQEKTSCSLDGPVLGLTGFVSNLKIEIAKGSSSGPIFLRDIVSRTLCNSYHPLLQRRRLDLALFFPPMDRRVSLTDINPSIALPFYEPLDKLPVRLSRSASQKFTTPGYRYLQAKSQDRLSQGQGIPHNLSKGLFL